MGILLATPAGLACRQLQLASLTKSSVITCLCQKQLVAEGLGAMKPRCSDSRQARGSPGRQCWILAAGATGTAHGSLHMPGRLQVA